jgi:GTP cyclohydrolase I
MSDAENDVQLGAIANAVKEILEGIGEDVDREGLRDTPQRVARMYAEVFGGLHVDPASVINTVFDDEHHEEMVMVKDIPFYSMCEHHLIPFHGKAHVAYLPRRLRSPTRSWMDCTHMAFWWSWRRSTSA